MKLIVSKFFLLGAFFFAICCIWSSKRAWAFPEMVRHGYVNCTSCHVSPSGGGVLTQYGRELSREVLSTWGTKNESEAAFAYGLVTLPDNVSAMGLYRGVYAYQDTPFVQQGEYIFMQNDIEGAIQLGKWSFDASVGYENQIGETSLTDHLISRRHYVGFRPTDELSFRFGRFFPAFGINTPEHVIPIKHDLGWDEGIPTLAETYNFEAAYIGEKWSVFAMGDLGRPDELSYHRETGFVLTPSLAVADTYKIGLNYMNGNGVDYYRNVEGVWGILGFTPRFFLLTEIDFQQKSSKTDAYSTLSGLVNYQRLDYELIQGLHVYLTQDFSELNSKDINTLHNSYGLGMQFFPRPHFEFNLSWQKLRTLAVTDQYTDFAWLMFNFYL